MSLSFGIIKLRGILCHEGTIFHKWKVQTVKHNAQLLLRMRFQIKRQSHHNTISTSLPDFSTILLNRIRDSRNNATTAMASSISTAVIFPLGFRNSFQNQAVRTVRLSPFAMKISHNLSFTRSVSGFAPTVVQRVPIVASPSRNNPKPLTIVAAKGYKMKTHKVKFFFVRIWSFCVFCELRFLCS